MSTLHGTQATHAERAGRGGILVIRRDNIGDLVCTTPLLAALRAQHPQAWIGVLANSYNAPALEGNPHVDAVLAYRKLKHLAPGESAAGALFERLRLLWRLRRRGLDLAVLAAGEEDRRGLSLARQVAARRIVWADAAREGVHEVERVFGAARALGIEGPPPGLTVCAREDALGHARAALRAGSVASAGGDAARAPVIGLHISARRPLQRWPGAQFAELARQLHARHAATIMLFWAPGAEDDARHPGDDGKADSIRTGLAGALPLVGYPTRALSELIGGLAACDLVVCADGGAMHLAAGLGRPVVALFGDSPAARWRPWGVPHVVLQPPDGDVRTLAVEDVAQACAGLLPAGRLPQPL